MKREIEKWMAEEVAEYDVEMSPAPRTILDIGANIGAFALRAHERWPKATIRCYEPVAANYRGLAQNVSALSKITAYRFAVRSFNGWDKILRGDLGVTCGFYHLGRQTEVTEKVMCADAAEIAGADLVKIDTEGCEVEIVSRLDLRKTRALVVEYHRAEDAGQIKKIAVRTGFRLLEERRGSSTHGILKFGKVGVKALACSVEAAPRQNPAGDKEVHVCRAIHPSPEASEDKAGPTLQQNERHIYVAIASHFSNHDITFLQSMMQLVLGARQRISFGWSTDPSVERARNVLTANFLETDCSHLLFIDSDIAFLPQDVARITSHDEDVVGGIYPLKTQSREVTWCGNGIGCLGKSAHRSVSPLKPSPGSAIAEPPSPAPAGEGTCADAVRPDGLQEVGCIGTGFMCVARRVFERIIELEGARICYTQDWPPYRKEYAFWRQTVREVGGARRFLTEDWNFCYHWRSLRTVSGENGKVFADTQVILRHAGRAVWPLDLQAGNPFVRKEKLNIQS